MRFFDCATNFTNAFNYFGKKFCKIDVVVLLHAVTKYIVNTLKVC